MPRASRTSSPSSGIFRNRPVQDDETPGGGAALAAGNIALGAGLGTTASVAVAAPSGSKAPPGAPTDTYARVTVTSAGTGQAQATATIALTFPGGAFDAAPTVFVRRVGGTEAATTQIEVQTVTASVVTFRYSALPVAANTLIFEFIVLP